MSVITDIMLSMDTIDPDKTYTVRFGRSTVFESDDGGASFEEVGEDCPHELEMTGAQVLAARAGTLEAFTPRDERILVEEDGTIVRRESAIPDAA